MKIDRIEVIPVSVPYKKSEVSSVVNRSGITEVIVKVFIDEGNIGWFGRCSREEVREGIRSPVPPNNTQKKTRCNFARPRQSFRRTRASW